MKLVSRSGEYKMKQLLKRLAPLVVLAVAVAVSYYFFATAPEPKRRPPKPNIPLIEVFQVHPVDYQVQVDSSGTVSPQISSTLVAEVSGRILRVADSFRNGGFFKKDDVLVEIEAEEYRLALANIEAELHGVTARLAELQVKNDNLHKSLAIEKEQLALAEEQYQRQQRLREQGTVSQSTLEQSQRELLIRRSAIRSLRNDLELIPVQRKILESEQQLKQVRFDQARLDLARTRVLAPYAGRVLEKRADIGQSVSKGSALAEIYAIDAAEVRLPITEREAGMLLLPEINTDSGLSSKPVPVTFFTNSGGRKNQWNGLIVRTEGAIDSKTRQQFLVARIDQPFVSGDHQHPPLKVGQYVEAQIPGRTLSNVFVIPRKAVRADDEVVLLAADGRIERRQIQVVWKDRSSVVVSKSLTSGERISLTALPYAPEGSKVRIKGQGKKGRRKTKEAN